MHCHHYKKQRVSPSVGGGYFARFVQCKSHAFAILTLRDKATGETTNLPVCYECWKTLSNDTGYEILKREYIENETSQ